MVTIFVKFMHKDKFVKVLLKKRGRPSVHNPLRKKYSKAAADYSS